MRLALLRCACVFLVADASIAIVTAVIDGEALPVRLAWDDDASLAAESSAAVQRLGLARRAVAHCVLLPASEDHERRPTRCRPL